MRALSPLDLTLQQLDRALRTLSAPMAQQTRPMPVPPGVGKSTLSEAQRRHSAGLMRINHAGEVAAQALYFGHAQGARHPDTREMLLHAAEEEADHLAWCTQRLQALHAKPSRFGLLWYGGAWMMGWLSAKVSDRVALGFVAETEAQVEAHLRDHEQSLSAEDVESLAIVRTMRAEEAEHGAAAMKAGGTPLPWPIPQLMAKTADFMRFVAYRI